jgi:nitronate monooxygenase
MQTRFTELLGITVPIQLAAMPGVGGPALVAAVSNAGGLGMLPGTRFLLADLEQVLDEVARRTPGVFGVNFLMPFLDLDAVDLAARRVPLVEFFYGEPDAALVERVHAHGARVSWQVGSAQEARRAERCGCDLVVAQGTEAGGHVRGGVGRRDVLEQVLKDVRLPVLAAGGVGNARDVADALALGASGVRVGTRFLAAREANTHPVYVDALIAASAQDTCLTDVFSIHWPDAPHRVLRSAVHAAEALPDGLIGETRRGSLTIPIERFSVFCPSTETTGRVEAMALYAGESVTDVRRVEPAADILRDLVRDLAR